MQADCVVVIGGKSREAGAWMDDTCDSKQGYICQTQPGKFCQTSPNQTSPARAGFLHVSSKGRPFSCISVGFSLIV